MLSGFKPPAGGETIAEDGGLGVVCAYASEANSKAQTAIFAKRKVIVVFTALLDAQNAPQGSFGEEIQLPETANVRASKASKRSFIEQFSDRGETLIGGKRGLLTLVAMIAAATLWAEAGDLRITIPRPGKLTPVQRLNRDGVQAIKQHNYSKAEKLFYKAYLFDPEDAFTLNNLGYVSELQGQVDRAEQYYTLAAAHSSEAVVDISSNRQYKGQPMTEALVMKSGPLEVNHANVEAVRLLSQGRAPEADLLLQEALKKDPHNIYTLNNMGAAKEMEGEEEEALTYYGEARAGQGDAKAMVTANPAWRGRSVSGLAGQNEKALRERLAHAKDLEEQVAELNLRGVSAVNRNDLRTAAKDFREAYSLDPGNAFAMNNIGFVSEMEGDQETAQFYYQHAREAMDARTTVGVASRLEAQGQRLSTVADDSTARVETKVGQERSVLQRQNEPVVLRRRDNSIVEEPSQAVPNQNPAPPQR